MFTTLPTFPLWFYIPAALLAALGLIGLYCSLFKGRHKGRLRCPKCWYDMQGTTPPARCPECGHTAATKADLQRTRRHWWHALAVLLLIVPLAVVFAKLHATKVYYAVVPKWKLAEEARWNDTTISRYRVRDPGAVFTGERVAVRSNGNTLIDHEDRSVSFNSNGRHETFVDLDNDGVNEVVIDCYSGGAHCCNRVYIVALRPTGANIVADIDAQNGLIIDTPEEPGGEYLAAIPDGSFAYWRAPYASSPRPIIRYRLKDGALRIAIDKLEKPALNSDKFDALVQTLKSECEVGGKFVPAPSLWDCALNRLFAGHDEEAWTLIDRVWTAPTGKAEFLAEFKDLLSKDPWYQDVVAARAARAAGKPIPPSTVGMSGRAADEATKPRG